MKGPEASWEHVWGSGLLQSGADWGIAREFGVWGLGLLRRRGDWGLHVCGGWGLPQGSYGLVEGLLGTARAHCKGVRVGLLLLSMKGASREAYVGCGQTEVLWCGEVQSGPRVRREDAGCMGELPQDVALGR